MRQWETKRLHFAASYRTHRVLAIQHMGWATQEVGSHPKKKIRKINFACYRVVRVGIRSCAQLSKTHKSETLKGREWLSTGLFKEPQKGRGTALLSAPALDLPHKLNLYKNIQVGGPSIREKLKKKPLGYCMTK